MVGKETMQLHFREDLEPQGTCKKHWERCETHTKILVDKKGRYCLQHRSFYGRALSETVLGKQGIRIG